MENIPYGLKEAIEKDELVLFIGAGLSWNLKNTEGKALGGWKEMVSSILSYLKDKEYITAEEQQSCEELGPIKALQRLENNKIDKRVIGHFVKRYFKLGKENNFSLQEKLYSLSTKIITTNYDLAFEKPIKKLRKEKAYKGQNHKLSKLMEDPVFLFKLHGCITKIKSLVLFPSDYRKLYNNYDRDAAFTLLAFKFLIFSKTFLFIGTGMDESQIINFFEEIKDIRGFYNQEHYIITTNPLNIPTNFLTSIKINDYAEIPSYIDKLLDIKEKAEEEKNPEKKLLLDQLEASEKEKKELAKKLDNDKELAKELDKEKDKNKRIALFLEREANNRFLTGLEHHIAKEYLEAIEEYKAATELKPEYSEAYYNWGNALIELAEIKSGNEAEELYKEACKKYDKAITFKKDFQEAYYNWGVALMELAKTKSGREAEELYKEAIEKYKLATTYKKDKQEAYNNWGVALVELAKTKSGREAEELYKEAIEKYKLATQVKQDFYEAYYNWGNALMKLAEKKSNSKAEELLNDACEKYDKAITYKQDYHKAYYNWGVALMELAKTKSGNEAGKLYKEAIEKYKLATTYKKDKQEAYNNWGFALMELAKTKSGSEAEILYNEAAKKIKLAIKHGGDAYYLACLYAIRNQKAEALKYLERTLSRNEITIDFVEQDEDWKNLRNDPDFQHLLSRYKK